MDEGELDAQAEHDDYHKTVRDLRSSRLRLARVLARMRTFESVGLGHNTLLTIAEAEAIVREEGALARRSDHGPH